MEAISLFLDLKLGGIEFWVLQFKIQTVGQKVYTWGYNTLRNVVNIFGGHFIFIYIPPTKHEDVMPTP
jgi:hypothetical protein